MSWGVADISLEPRESISKHEECQGPVCRPDVND